MTKANRPALCASFRYAIEGVIHVLRTERNARIHAVIAVLVVLLGLWLDLDTTRWALLVFAIVLVLTGEMLNTVVELLVDIVVREPHALAKHAKDVAAGAVLLAACGAAVIGCLVLGPPLYTKIAAFIAP